VAFFVGEWLVEPALNRISRSDRVVRLEPKVMELLVLLAARSNEVVAKDEISRSLWPEVFVTESSIFRHVSLLRRALADDRKEPRYLQTIPKKGYRLVGVRSATPAVPSTARIAAGVAAFLLLLLAAFYVIPDGGGRPRIAIVPFRDLAPESGDHFARGMEAMLRNKLVLVEGIDVVRSKDLEVARISGADALLQGTVDVSGDDVTLHLELTTPSTTARLWSGRYTGTLGDVVSRDNEMVLEVVRSFDVELSARDERRLVRAPRSVDADAYRSYLEGELFENRVDCASFDRAIDSYSDAVQRDGAFFDVYPRLVDALVATAVLGCRPAGPVFIELESLLEDAERRGLDERRRTEGWAALRLWRDGDVPWALAAFQAWEDETPDSDRDMSYAVALALSGSQGEGVLHAHRCLEALPIDLGENWALGGLLYLTGRYEEAIDQFLATLELYPDYRPALQLLAMSYLMAGHGEQALEAAERAESLAEGRWNRFDAVPGYVYASTGDVDRARAILDVWLSRSRGEWVPRTSLALLYLGLGEREEARRWLARAREEQDPWAVLAPADPVFRSLIPPAAHR
jgi:DNA-binding winged helix-turn-helix (wHTH) protein/TolB-like protein/Flp pilus assembly protein TadD